MIQFVDGLSFELLSIDGIALHDLHCFTFDAIALIRFQFINKVSQRMPEIQF